MGDLKSDNKNTRRFSLKFSKNTDAEVIARLEEQPSKQTYIRKLILDDIERSDTKKRKNKAGS